MTTDLALMVIQFSRGAIKQILTGTHLQVLVLVLVLAPDEGVEPGGGHERGSDGLDLLHVAEL